MSLFRKINSRYFLIVFLFTSLSGALRKWFFEDANLKNGLFAIQIIIPFVFFLNNDMQISKAFKIKALSIYLFTLIMMAINPLNQTIYHGIIGIFIHFSFWFLTFYYVANRESFDFKNLLNYILILALSEFILGALQYQLPGDNFLNRYADLEKVGGNIAGVGNSVRVTGTFSYISGYTSFLVFYNYFIWALFRYGIKPYIFIALIAVGIYANLISGSRGANYSFLLFLAVLFFVEWRFINGKTFLKLIFPLLIFFMILLATNTDKITTAFLNAFSNFNERRIGGVESGEEVFRIFWDILSLVNFTGNYPFFGVGLGATYQGATSFFGTSRYLVEYGYYEGELVRIVLEGGFLLLLFRIFLAIILIKKLNFPILLKFFIFFQIIYLNQIVFNVYNSVYFALGLIILDSAFYRTQNNLIQQSFLATKK